MGGELSTFNVKDGYAESLLRGNRLALLTPDDYRKLAMAESLEDLRSCLEDTDYGSLLQDEPLPLSITAIGAKIREKFSDEFRTLQSHANFPLSRFLEYIIAERMIDNVVSIIQGALNGKPADELIARADPLAWTPEMRALLTLDANTGFDELYRTVLVETPVGRYFDDFLEQREERMGLAAGGRNEMEEVFQDLDLDVMRASLKKSWLEDFNSFCMELGGTTAEVMSEVLMKQADFLTLSITLNSLNLSAGNGGLADRIHLYPAFGYLYPSGVDALRKAHNDASIRTALESYPAYLELYEQCRGFYVGDDAHGQGETGTSQQLSLEDGLYRQEVKIYEMNFEQQMHYGVFYAWVKLKEQEIRNILWIADMIVMHRRDHMDMVLPIFAPRIG